jgi:D-alanyl-D-alanine carboxypeptidase
MAPEQYYGLGTISGSFDGWDWFGHSGGLQGYISRTCVFPGGGLTVCVLTNAVDGWAHPWVDGIVNILQAFARNGAPTRRTKGWSGRWWSLWTAIDLVPVGNKVLALAPGLLNPMTNAPELAIASPTTGRIALAPGFGSHGEPVRCMRAKSGRITEVWLGGTRLLPAARVAAELEARYAKKPRQRKTRGRR